MARLTEAEARALGIGLTKAPKGKPRTKADAPKGRDRAARAVHPGPEVSFEVPLPFDPRPKERPRTVAGLDGLRSAFFSSSGSAEAFVRAASATLGRAYRASGGRFEAFVKAIGGGSRTFTPKTTADYERIVAHAARAAMGGRPPFVCPVETSIMLVLKGDPGTWPTSRLDGDGDNMEKAVLDALNGIVFEDDRLVVRSFREKACGPESKVSIRVAPARPDTAP